MKNDKIIQSLEIPYDVWQEIRRLNPNSLMNTLLVDMIIERLRDEKAKDTMTVRMTSTSGSTEYTLNSEEVKKYNISVGSEGKDSYRVPLNVRFDLIPAIFLRALAEVYEEGAHKYGPNMYRTKPLPVSNVLNHLENHLNLWKCGDRTETHLAKIAWAVATIMVLEAEGKPNDMNELGGVLDGTT